MKILLVGGGTGGPVAPLLAIAQEIRAEHPKAQFLFVGTSDGPAKAMAESIQINFVSISAGKWRRYFSFKNLLTVFQVIFGFVESFKILDSFQPDCIVGAGGFVQVPLIWAGYFKKIPSLIHQQDVLPGLANRLCQFPAKKITVCFESTAKTFISHIGFFYKKQKTDKISVTGNPVRTYLKQGEKTVVLKHFKLNDSLPVLLVLGGGTGSQYFNSLIAEAMPELAKTVQILHSTGQRKAQSITHENYHSFEFIDKADLAFAAADIVLCRAGLATMSELSFLKKTAIVVPIPDTHQEYNAVFLHQMKAAVVISQENLTAQNLQKLIKKILFNLELQKTLQKNIAKIMPHNAGKKIAEIVIKLALSNARE